jgi:hypothetical protein
LEGFNSVIKELMQENMAELNRPQMTIYDKVEEMQFAWFTNNTRIQTRFSFLIIKPTRCTNFSNLFLE